jgi:putative lipoic acid-binding regulatory protein
MSGQGDLLAFPCAFPLKVVGLDTEGKYLSVTATFAAESREQVDAIYRELNGHDLVVMTL